LKGSTNWIDFSSFGWPHRSTADMPMTHRAMDAAAAMDGPVAPELDAELLANDMAMAKEMNPEAQEGALDSRSFYPGLGYYSGGYAEPGYVTKTSYSSVQAPGVHHYTSRNHFVTQRSTS
jgi:hypothetical protein